MIGTWYPTMYQNQMYQVPPTISYNTSNSFDWSLSDSLDLDLESFKKNTPSVDKFIKNFVRSTSFTPQTSEQMSKLLQLLQMCISNLKSTVEIQKERIEQLKTKYTTANGNVKDLKQKFSNKTSVMCPLCLKGYHKMKSLDQHFAKRHRDQLKYWLVVRGKKNQINIEHTHDAEKSDASTEKTQNVDIDDEELTLRVLEAMNKTTYRTDRQKLIESLKSRSDSDFDFEPKPLQPFNQKSLNKTLPMPRKRTPIKRSVIHTSPPDIKMENNSDSKSSDSPKPTPKIVRKRLPPPELKESSDKKIKANTKIIEKAPKEQNISTIKNEPTEVKEGKQTEQKNEKIDKIDSEKMESVVSEHEAATISNNNAKNTDSESNSDKKEKNEADTLLSTDKRNPSPPNLDADTPATPKDSSTSDFDYVSDPSSVEFEFVARPPVKPVTIANKQDGDNIIPNWAATDIVEESENESKSVSHSASKQSLSESKTHAKQRSDQRKLSWESEYGE